MRNLVKVNDQDNRVTDRVKNQRIEVSGYKSL